MLYVLTVTNEDEQDFAAVAASDSVDALKQRAFNSEMYPEDEDWTWVDTDDDKAQTVRIGDYIVYRIEELEVV